MGSTVVAPAGSHGLLTDWIRFLLRAIVHSYLTFRRSGYPNMRRNSCSLSSMLASLILSYSDFSISGSAGIGSSGLLTECIRFLLTAIVHHFLTWELSWALALLVLLEHSFYWPLGEGCTVGALQYSCPCLVLPRHRLHLPHHMAPHSLPGHLEGRLCLPLPLDLLRPHGVLLW